MAPNRRETSVASESQERCPWDQQSHREVKAEEI